ncbi:MAG: hypothetical protein DMG94_05245 [Acidobacteria bacterium]|nr:MAG: hypothetical protein DMG94_05245 [Acidobacteriota bacterium]
MKLKEFRMKTKVVANTAMLALLCVSFWGQQASSPQSNTPNAELEQHIRELEDRLIALEGKIRTMESEKAAAAQSQPGQPTAQPEPSTAAQTTVPSQAATVPQPATANENQAGLANAEGQLPIYGGNSAAAKALNPDISVIGDFIGAAGGNTPPPLATLQPFPSMQMHESEIGLQAIIDPYARGDFFISFGEEGVNLEEGYITFTALPGGFVAKVGKMRSVFGKVNTLHNHVLPWVDRPLVTTNLVGGEDGIDDAGFSLERILPAPKGIFLDVTGQVFRSTVEHLRAYRDLNESTNLDIGVSYARGHNNGNLIVPGDFITQLYGVDATVRWKPLRRSIYHSFVGRSEFIWSQRQQFPREQKSFGGYASGDYQFGRRWFAGGRFDWSERSQFDNLMDKGAAATVTYWPSEFSQLRGEYRFTRYAENRDSNELLMQLIFSLGAHGAHPF